MKEENEQMKSNGKIRKWIAAAAQKKKKKKESKIVEEDKISLWFRSVIKLPVHPWQIKKKKEIQ